jgi:hypothetical protein
MEDGVAVVRKSNNQKKETVPMRDLSLPERLALVRTSGGDCGVKHFLEKIYYCAIPDSKLV